MTYRDTYENLTPQQLAIESLGPCKVSSPLKGRKFVPEERSVTVYADLQRIERCISSGRPLPAFQQAGARELIYHDPSWSRAAIVTCGGICPGINDVIKSLVQILYFEYGVDNIYGIRYGYQGLVPDYGHAPMILEPRMATNIHDMGGTILGSSRGDQDVPTMVDTLERMNINLLFCVGGDGTLRGASAIAAEIRRRGVKISVVGVPKTIDNDLSFVGRTFGFETAVYRTADIIRTAYFEAMGAHRGIGLVKLMGRDSGFIAAYASLATSVVDFCLIPEIEIELEGEGGLLAALERRLAGEQKWAVVVVAEGAGQHLFSGEMGLDASGNRLKHDVGALLKSRISDHFAQSEKPVVVRYFDPSYLIRGVPAQGTDSIFCAQLAEHAVHAAMAGKTNMVVGTWANIYTHVPIALATAERQKIRLNSTLWKGVLGATRQADYFAGRTRAAKKKS